MTLSRRGMDRFQRRCFLAVFGSSLTFFALPAFAIQKGIEERHFSLGLLFLIEGGVVAFCLLLATAIERAEARLSYNAVTRIKQLWQANVPESLYGPLEPTVGFEILVASSKDDFDAGLVRFDNERQRWHGRSASWQSADNRLAAEREETVPLAAGVEEIATRWVDYCIRVAHENALSWAEQQEAEPQQRAEQELLAERKREQVPISPYLPTSADVMRSFPLDRELWPALPKPAAKT